MIDDFCEHIFFLCHGNEFVELLQRKHRGLFDQHMFAGSDNFMSRFEVPIIWCGNASQVDVGTEHLVDRVVAGVVLKCVDNSRIGYFLLIGIGSLAGA